MAKNSTGDAAPYHHGALRQTLIDHACDVLEADGLAKLSLRKLAALAGVSHNAPYMHFKDKHALLDAVAVDGFARLGKATALATGPGAFSRANWRERVLAGLTAYSAFAQDHPALYALMHQPRAGHAEPAISAGQATLDALARTLAAGQAMGLVRTGEAGDQALLVWSSLHGLAGLSSASGQALGRDREAVTALVLTALLDGLAA